MRRLLYELVTGFAAAAGCGCEVEEGSCRACLSVEGVVVHIGLLEESGMLVFQTGVSTVPAGEDGREEFCMKLLAANNLFGGTMGFTLGVDESQDIVTLQLAWDALHLDAEGFSHIVNNLLSVSLDWMVRLQNWRPSPPERAKDSAPEASFMMHFLKV